MLEHVEASRADMEGMSLLTMNCELLPVVLLGMNKYIRSIFTIHVSRPVESLVRRNSTNPVGDCVIIHYFLSQNEEYKNTTMTGTSDEPLPRVWQIVDRGSMECDPESKQKIQQLYSGVADLYHEFRPRYPEDLVDEAIQKSKLLHKNPNAKILEVGCGPGTLTISLAKRGYDIVAIDPGVGMIEKARQVCQDYSNVQFRQETLKEFSTNDSKFDAIIAASSLHWALAEGDKDTLIEKMSNLLKEDGSLILFWNFPPEPNDEVLEKMAESLEKPKPFHFGNGSLAIHWQRMRERVLGPIEDSQFFTPFETIEHPLAEEIPIDSYISFLKTLSNYITMEEGERESFFEIVKKTFLDECGNIITTHRKSILNVSLKSKTS